MKKAAPPVSLDDFWDDDHAPSAEGSHEAPIEALLTTEAVAVVLGCSHSKVRRLANKGRIKRIRIEGSVRFDPVEIQAYVDACREE